MPNLDKYLTPDELATLERLFAKYCRTLDKDEFDQWQYTRQEILAEIHSRMG